MDIKIWALVENSGTMDELKYFFFKIFINFFLLVGG